MPCAQRNVRSAWPCPLTTPATPSALPATGRSPSSTIFLDSAAELLLAIHPDLALLADAARAAVLDGGKRLRPTFAYWGWRCVLPADAAGERDLIRAAASLELLQACALVHDDVMDGSATRRGQPAAHVRFGSVALASTAGRAPPATFGAAGAILLGDLLLSWAEEMFTAAIGQLPPNGPRPPTGEFDLMRTEVVAGQFLDVLAQTRGDFDPDEALRVIRVQDQQVHRPAAAAARRAGGRRAGPACCRAGRLRARRSARRSSCATTCSACSATRPRPASRPATTCARASGRCWWPSRSRPPTRGKRRLLRAGIGNPDLTAAEVAELRAVLRATGARDAGRAADRRAGGRGGRTASAAGRAAAGRPDAPARSGPQPPRTEASDRCADSAVESDRVVIIGAGLAGLSAALAVGRRRPGPSGSSRPARRAGWPDGPLAVGGYTFDTGPTVLTMPALIDDALACVGESRSDWLQLDRLEPSYLAHYADGSMLRSYADPARMADEVARVCGPAEARGYLRLVDYLRRAVPGRVRHLHGPQPGLGHRPDPAAGADAAAPGRAAQPGPGGRWLSQRRPGPPAVHLSGALRRGFAAAGPGDLCGDRLPGLGGRGLVPARRHALGRQALAGAAVKHGVQIDYDSRASRVEVPAGRARRCITEHGERIAGRCGDRERRPGHHLPQLLPAELGPAGCTGSPGRATRRPPWSGWSGSSGALPQPAHHSISFGAAWSQTFDEIIDRGPADDAIRPC